MILRLKFLGWRRSFQSKNAMISKQLLLQDVEDVCKVIDESLTTYKDRSNLELVVEAL